MSVQAPIYDVPTAAEVLETGSYPLLPAIIAELRPPPPPKPSERADALRLMNQRIRMELLKVGRCGIASGLTSLMISCMCRAIAQPRRGAGYIRRLVDRVALLLSSWKIWVVVV